MSSMTASNVRKGIAACLNGLSWWSCRSRQLNVVQSDGVYIGNYLAGVRLDLEILNTLDFGVELRRLMLRVLLKPLRAIANRTLPDLDEMSLARLRSDGSLKLAA